MGNLPNLPKGNSIKMLIEFCLIYSNAALNMHCYSFTNKEYCMYQPCAKDDASQI